MYAIVQWLAENRCDRELAELRGTSRWLRAIVDRAWRIVHAQYIEMGLPVPRLCRDVAPNQIGCNYAAYRDSADGPKPTPLYTLVEARDLGRIRKLVTFWGSLPIVSDMALRAAIRIDFPECMPLIMPLIQMYMDRFKAHITPVLHWREMILDTTESVFLRWAPFFYWLYPMVESDASDLLSLQVCWGVVDGDSVTTTYRDGMITLRNKPRTVQWIEDNWTQEHKNRVSARIKWWIQNEQ
jgi:hypothetical protein